MGKQIKYHFYNTMKPRLDAVSLCLAAGRFSRFNPKWAIRMA